MINLLVPEGQKKLAGGETTGLHASKSNASWKDAGFLRPSRAREYLQTISGGFTTG
jgi:hypothetical protein